MTFIIHPPPPPHSSPRLTSTDNPLPPQRHTQTHKLPLKRLGKEAAEASGLRERGRELAREVKRLTQEAETRQGRLDEAREKGARAEEVLKASQVGWGARGDGRFGGGGNVVYTVSRCYARLGILGHAQVGQLVRLAPFTLVLHWGGGERGGGEHEVCPKCIAYS